MGVCIPEELGGAGADFVSYMLVLEEISRADAGIGVTVAVHSSAATVPILALRNRGAEGRARPAARTRGEDRRVRADRVGRRLRRALAPHQGRAQTATAGGSPARSSGSRAGASAAPSSSSRARRSTGASRASSSTAAPRGSRVTKEDEDRACTRRSTVDLVLDGVEVAGDRMLGEEGKGFTIAMATLDGGRIGIAAQAVGIAQAAFDAACAYALERQQFGKRIAEFRRSRASSPTWRRRSTRHGCSCSARRGCATRGARTARRARRRSSSRRARAPADRRGDPDPRRLRLHDRVPGRALLPRREDHGDLRGHERDPAARDRAIGARPRRARRLRYDDRKRTNRFGSTGSTPGAATRARRASATARGSRRRICASRPTARWTS